VHERRQHAAESLDGNEILIRIDRQVRHSLYGKTVRRSSKLAAHDEAFQIDPGIWVRLDFAVPVRIVSRGGAIAGRTPERADGRRRDAARDEDAGALEQRRASAASRS